MADGVLSFPFRMDPQGHAATAPFGSNQEIDEAIAVLVLTLMGERPMNPAFGVPDPVFAGLGTGDVQVGLDEFGPAGVMVTSVEQAPLTDTESVATIRWQHIDTMEAS